jgi:hypothetical protein
MSSKLSIVKSIAVSVALAAGVSGIARADDSSMDPITGDSYAHFNGGNLSHITKPVFDNAPSAWRQSHPNGLSVNQIAAMSTPVFKPAPVLHNELSAWRQSHPSGVSNRQFAAMGSEAIAARPLPNQAETTAIASTNDAADIPSASREPFGARIARLFHVKPANQATPGN